MTSKESIDITLKRVLNFINLTRNVSLYKTERDDKGGVSFYIFKTETINRPFLILRITNHHPKHKTSLRNGHPLPSEEDNTNLSIEFYEALKKPNGKGNRHNSYNNVVNLNQFHNPNYSFEWDSYSYTPEKLNENDLLEIYYAIEDWLDSDEFNTPYIDPMKGDKKALQIPPELKRSKTKSIIFDDEAEIPFRYTQDGKEYINFTFDD